MGLHTFIGQYRFNVKIAELKCIYVILCFFWLQKY